ncbi:MAG: thioredoxin family protein [Cyclobacteriaceae bacterium]
MKLLSALTFCLFISLASFAQDINSKFHEAQDKEWLVDIDEAYQISKQTNKPILANFTGSDWCGWCKKLRSEVFSKQAFKEWAKDNVVLLELDFPRRKRLPEQQMMQNRGLQQAFQVRGYPTIWVFDLEKPDPNGQFQIHALGKTGYIRGGSDNFTREVDKMIARKTAAAN